MEVKINKEIRDFKEHFFFGLSVRQCVFSLLACIVAITLYFILKQYFNIETLSWICILGAFPFAILGFVTYNGMPAEKFVVALFKNEITPKRLLRKKASSLKRITVIEKNPIRTSINKKTETKSFLSDSYNYDFDGILEDMRRR